MSTAGSTLNNTPHGDHRRATTKAQHGMIEPHIEAALRAHHWAMASRQGETLTSTGEVAQSAAHGLEDTIHHLNRALAVAEAARIGFGKTQ